MVDYLPSPFERPLPGIVSCKTKKPSILTPSDKTVALAFKVMYDENRGPLGTLYINNSLC